MNWTWEEIVHHVRDTALQQVSEEAVESPCLDTVQILTMVCKFGHEVHASSSSGEEVCEGEEGRWGRSYTEEVK